MTTIQVVKGTRYAVGIDVPFYASFASGPLAELRGAVEAEGFAALAPDTATGKMLEEQGWTNAIAYKGDMSPVPAPSPVDYVVIATRGGDSAAIDTEDPQWAGAIKWIVPTAGAAEVARPGQPGGDGEIPTWVKVAGGVLVAGAVVALAVGMGEGKPRRNPQRAARRLSGAQKTRYANARGPWWQIASEMSDDMGLRLSMAQINRAVDEAKARPREPGERFVDALAEELYDAGT